MWRIRGRIIGQVMQGYARLISEVMSYSSQAQRPPPGQVPCRECNAPLQNFMHFCWHCGAKQIQAEQANIPEGL